jgi:hypothetical protein
LDELLSTPLSVLSCAIASLYASSAVKDFDVLIVQNLLATDLSAIDIGPGSGKLLGVYKMDLDDKEIVSFRDGDAITNGPIRMMFTEILQTLQVLIVERGAAFYMHRGELVYALIMRVFSILQFTPAMMTAFINSGLPIPFSFLLFRMDTQFKAGSTIFMKAGKDTGETIMQGGRVMFQRDMGTSQVKVSAAFKVATVIQRPQLLEVIPHTYATQYVGGAGTTFRMRGDPENHRGDMYCVVVPYGFQPAELWTDITGSLQNEIIGDFPLDDNNRDGYPTHGVNALHYEWDHEHDRHDPFFIDPSHNTHVPTRNNNTLAVQGWQAQRDASGVFNYITPGIAMGLRDASQFMNLQLHAGNEYSGGGPLGSVPHLQSNTQGTSFVS